MKSRTIATTLLLSASLVAAPGTFHAQAPAAAAAGARPHAIVVLPDAIEWGPAPAILPAGAQAAVLEGDPSKPGPFTLRLVMPANYRIPPHYHPAPEHVTVLEGAFHVGMGDTFDAAKATALPTGTFAALGPEVRHFAFTESRTVIQLHGIGPWSLVYVDPADDPRNPPRD
jgi:hypothetical protein